MLNCSFFAKPMYYICFAINRDMRQSTFLLLCFFWVFGSVSAQTEKTDSLRNALANAKSDIDKAQLLNSLADQYKQSDPKQMLAFANQALSLSQKLHFAAAEGNAYLNIGNANIISGNYPEALRSFANAQTVFEKEQDTNPTKEIKTALARAYGSIGIVFSEQSNYARALQYHLKAVRIYEALGDLNKCARVYNNIGIVYKAQNDNFRALEYFTKCLKAQEKTGDETLGITTTNIGNVYLAQKNYPKALEYYTKARSLFEKFPNP
ncbi:MAG: tetratricopeptide repeat protein, partial [Flavobacterium sp.]